MCIGAKKLNKYLDDKKLNNRQFAEKIGVTTTCIWYLRKGKRKPGTELAIKLKKVTKIKIDDWHAEV